MSALPPRPLATDPLEHGRFVADGLAALVAAAGEYRVALSTLARLPVPQLAEWCAVYAPERDGTVRQRAAAHVDPERARLLRELGRSDAGHSASDGLVARVMRTGRTVLLGPPPATTNADPRSDTPISDHSLISVATGVSDGEVLAEDDVTTALCRALTATSTLVVPVAEPEAGTARGVSAVLVAGRGATAPAFTPAEQALVETLAGRAAAVIALARELDGERQARAEAEAARQQVTSALEELPEGFVTLDRQWRVTYLNPAAARLGRRRREDLVGRTLWALLPGAAGTPFFTEGQRAMEQGVAAEVEAFYAPLGVWLNVRAVPTSQGLSVYLRDVSTRRAGDAERERLLAVAEAARTEAERANQAKSDFLASMSHELRTPLNAVLGYVSLIADGISGPVTPMQLQQLGRVRASTQHLLTLIEEILSFARLEAGINDVRPEAADAGDLVREAATLIEPVVEARGLRFSVQAPEAPLPVVTDVRKVRQILLNLLANAARFTPPGGGVTLSARLEGADASPAGLPNVHPGDGARRVTFEVGDSGIGIAPEHHERIFEPFWQVEQTKTRQTGGTGLGLSISRRFARLLGGDVTVESAPGAGSTFTVRLPAHVTSGVGPRDAVANMGRGEW